MSISITNSTQEPRAFSIGPVKVQLLDYVANSGETAGTVTANNLHRLDHVLLLGSGGLQHSAAPTYSGNVATLAFVVPTETASELTIQAALTFTAVPNLGASGDDISIEIVGGGTQGQEAVTVDGTAITIEIEDGVSTATEVKAAYDLVAEAVALATVAIESGQGSTAIEAAAADNLAGGVTGGARGTLVAIGV